MAVCNLFKAFTKTTGNFLLFSQYAEDLTRMTSDGSHYRVVPSKFVVMNLNWDPADKQNIVKLYGNPNAWLPMYLQNYYENGLAVLRNKDKTTVHEKRFEYSPNMSKWLFWKAMFDANYLNQSAQDGAVNEVKYVGNINLQSYDRWAGMGYSEVYCYIPNDARSYRYAMSRVAPQTVDSVETAAGSFLEGYTERDIMSLDENDQPLYNSNASELQLLKSINYTYQRIYEFSWEDDWVDSPELRPSGLSTNDGIEDDFFEFNSIVVLYDVLSLNEDGSWKTEYHDLPMGIYVCGTLQESTTIADWQIMTNTFRKFISNEDIYGSGTSYGLRICSRYLVNPNNDTIKNIEVHTSNEGYAEFSRVMSSFADMQAKMDEIMDGVLQNAETSKDIFGIFKNSRTNVPYIKEVEGKKHWFVNGRDLGEAGDGSGHGGCDNVWWGDDVQQRLDELEESLENNLRISGYITDDADGQEIVDGIVENRQALFGQNVAHDITLHWNVTFKGHDIYPDEQSINNYPVSPIARQYKFAGVDSSTKYAILALWGQYRALLTLPLIFVNPTLYGRTSLDYVAIKNNPNLILDTLTGKFNSHDPLANDEIKKTLLIDPIIDFSQSQHNQRAIVCIPENYEQITRIYDPDFRAFNYIEDFHRFEIELNGIPYVVYLAKIPVTVDNFHYRFDHTSPADDGDY